MAFEISKANQLLVQGLNARAIRQDLVAGNIANVDTPFYKARDIDFETTLIEKTKEIYGDGSKMPKLEMAQTDGKHLNGVSGFDPAKATIYLRDGQMARNDANTVDLDVETSALSKNAVMFNALTSALQKDSLIFKSVIDSSSRV